MIIKRVTVKRLRAIRGEKTVEFSPGLNIIKGKDNEAGKSSLRMAITKALFQDPTTTREDIQALTSWGTDEPWEVALEFESNDSSYQIIKSFKDKTCELTATGAQKFVATNKNTIAEKIGELTGCPSEVFFESTACLGQEELIRLIPPGTTPTEKQNARGTITKRLEAKLSGTEGVDIPAILDRLYSKTHRKDADGPYRHLQEIAERLAELRGQKQEQEKKVTDVLEKRRKLNQVKEELQKIDQELPEKRGVMDKNQRRIELQKEVARDKAQYENFQKAQEFKLRADALDSELVPLSSFLGAEERIEKLEATQHTLDVLSRQRADLQNDLKTLQEQKPPLWTLLSGAVLMAGGLIGTFIAHPYLVGIALMGVLLASYWLITHRLWKRQLESASGKMSELEAQIQRSEGEAGRLLGEFGCSGYQEEQKRLADFRAKTSLKRDLLNKLETLVAGKEWQRFVEENADLDIQMSARLKELEQLEPFKLEPFALQRLEDEVGGLQKRRSELEQEKGGLEKFLEYTDADRDQLTEVEEELKDLEQRKEFWERARKVYDLTRETLEEAHQQTLSKAADLLESEISRYIAGITSGRYSQVKIDGSDLSIRTFSPEKRDWVDVNDLSRATQDQFYLCARLALVRLITEGKRPPLLLDDPLVNFHAERLRKTVLLLQELAKENQILLFTCSDAYDYLGKVISLD
ncbi:MAG: AAA family ATPase, partial [Chloroflexota bacterium]